MIIKELTKGERVLMDLRARIINGGIIGESDYRDLYFRCFGKSLSSQAPITYDPELSAELLFDLNETKLLFSFDETLSEEKRIKSGSYYTPIPLVKSLWLMTLVQFFANQGDAERDKLYAFFQLKTQNLTLYNSIRPQLDALVVADIAAGSGQMLVGYVEILKSLDEHYLGRSIGIDLSKFYLADQRLEALETTLLVTLIWKHKGIINALPQFIHGDSLEEHGDLSLKLPVGSADVLIGNPPYLGEKNNREIFEKIKKTPWGTKYYEGKMDLFYFFIYKGMSLLKPKGVLAYITTRYFVTADGARGLRRFLKDSCQVLAFHQIVHKAFKSAPGQDNCLFALSHISQLPIEIGNIDKHYHFKIHHRTLAQEKLYTREGNILIADSAVIYNMVPFYQRKDIPTLGDCFQVNQGLVSGYDRHTTHTGEEPVFVFEEQEITQGSSYFRPFYKNSDIDAYMIRRDTSRQILYITHDDILSETNWEYAHLTAYRKKLTNRREFKEGKRPWYALHWFRQPSIFTGAKIVVPQRSVKPRFAYHEGAFYASADVYFIKATKGEENALISLMVYLNSPVCDYYFYHFGKRKGANLELYATPLLQLPLPADPKWMDKLYPLGKSLVEKGDYSDEDLKRLDEAVYEVMQWNQDAIDTVKQFTEKRRAKP